MARRRQPYSDASRGGAAQHRRNAAIAAVRNNPNNNENDVENNAAATYEILPEHTARINDTMYYTESETTRQVHRRRLRTMIKWICDKYPQAEQNGEIKLITEEERADNNRFYYKKDIKDFDYKKINVKLVKAFLTTIKRENPDGVTGKARSISHVRKFHDAVLFGARKQDNAQLPAAYELEMHEFLDGIKKEINSSKKENNSTDTNVCDGVKYEAYVSICKWFVESRDLYGWCFLLLQWNCMARTASIDALGLHNLSLGLDSLVITYDDSKTDKTGDRVSPKNCYANPYIPHMNMFLSLGIWLMTKNFDDSEKLFLHFGTQYRTGSRKFSVRLKQIVKNHYDELVQYGKPSLIRGHSARKGSATYVTANSLVAPHHSAISHRGEWSQGIVQDVYFLYGEVGDYYLGRMLAGLDPSDKKFKILPPHFVCGYEHPDVKNAVDTWYHMVLRNRSEVEKEKLKGVLVLLLASVVYHSRWIYDIILKDQAHPFANLPIFQDRELLNRLKKLVTTNITENMRLPTGIPPYIDTNTKLDWIINEIINLKMEKKMTTEMIQDACKEAIEKNDVRSLLPIMPAIENMIEKKLNKIEQHVGTLNNNFGKLLCNNSNNSGLSYGDDNNNNDELFNNINNNNNNLLSCGNNNNNIGGLLFDIRNTEDTTTELPTAPVDCRHDNLPIARGLYVQNNQSVSIYMYDGRSYMVPKDFKFPKNPERFTGWVYWLKGDKNYTYLEDGREVRAPIRPYRLLKSWGIPERQQQNIFNSSWQPIFSLMEKCPGLSIPDHPDKITRTYLMTSFEMTTEFLKNRVSYIFNSEKMAKSNIANWSIATWSLHVSPCQIDKYGTENDKLQVVRSNRCGPKTNARKVVPKNNKKKITKANIQVGVPVNETQHITVPVVEEGKEETSKKPPLPDNFGQEVLPEAALPHVMPGLPNFASAPRPEKPVPGVEYEEKEQDNESSTGSVSTATLIERVKNYKGQAGGTSFEVANRKRSVDDAIGDDCDDEGQKKRSLRDD